MLACTGTSGAWAECVAVDARLACRKPARLSFEQAAALPVGGITALGAVRKAGVEAGQRVLVYGSSGGVGLFAVQCAKAADAHVTGVCSTRNLEAARMAGAERVIDYTQDDFAQTEGRYNVIIGANGCNPLSVYRRLLAAGGTYVAVGDAKQGMAGLAGPVRSLGSSKRLIAPGRGHGARRRRRRHALRRGRLSPERRRRCRRPRRTSPRPRQNRPRQRLRITLACLHAAHRKAARARCARAVVVQWCTRLN